jgi:predicted metal-dependent enzyme (double-stranded beta helix superfamily)
MSVSALTFDERNVPDSLPRRHLAEIARDVAAQPDLWLPKVQFVEEHRWYERLSVAPDHEVWLLTWLPGQGTEIHDHGGSAGTFAVVRGELSERSFPRAGRRSHPSPWALPSGSLRAFGPQHIHEVANQGSEPAVSIHVYSPALTTMSYYHHDSRGRLEWVRSERVDDERVLR